VNWLRNTVFKVLTVIGTIWFIFIILNLGNKYLKSINYGKDFGKSDFQIIQEKKLKRKRLDDVGKKLKKLANEQRDK
jgi:hypothetical protein